MAHLFAAQQHRAENLEWNADPRLTKRIVPAIIRERDWVAALN